MVTIDADHLKKLEAMIVEENAFLFESPSSYSAGVRAMVEALEERPEQAGQVTGSRGQRRSADG
jgi:hypothetical protein